MPEKKKNKLQLQEEKPKVKHKHTLSPISVLFKDTWNIYKKTLITYIKIVGVGIGLVALGAIVGILLAVPLFISSGGNVERLYTNPSFFEIFGLLVLLLWLLAFTVILCIYSLAVPISYLFVLSEQKRLSIKALFIKSKQYFVPYFLASLLVGIAVIGGTVVFIIPGLVIAVLFTFVIHVVVLEKRKGINALQRSYQLITSHFWEIIVRLILIQIIAIVIGKMLNIIAEEIEIVSILSRIFSLAYEWFIVIYTYLLYQQVKDLEFTPTKNKLLWIWIIAAVGWVALFVLFFLVIAGIFNTKDVETFAELVSSSS